MRKKRIKEVEEGGGEKRHRSRGDRAICTATSCHASRLGRRHESRLPLNTDGACSTDGRSDLIRCWEKNFGPTSKGILIMVADRKEGVAWVVNSG